MLDVFRLKVPSHSWVSAGWLLSWTKKDEFYSDDTGMELSPRDFTDILNTAIWVMATLDFEANVGAVWGRVDWLSLTWRGVRGGLSCWLRQSSQVCRVLH